MTPLLVVLAMTLLLVVQMQRMIAGLILQTIPLPLRP